MKSLPVSKATCFAWPTVRPTTSSIRERLPENILIVGTEEGDVFHVDILPSMEWKITNLLPQPAVPSE